MEVRSIYKAARVSPKKARDVAREIQGLPVSDAIDALTFTPRKAAFLINKTLKSAVANAENNHELAADNLTVKEANVSDGPTFKRFKPRARGSASSIRKRTSHISIILTDEAPVEEPTRDRSGSSKKAKKETPKPKAEKKPVEEEVVEEEVVEEEVIEAEAAEEAPVAEEATEAAEEASEEESK